MISVENRQQRVLESALKIQSPFELDDSLCLYSPQDNYDALTHPRIADWLGFIQDEYQPALPDAPRRVLLFMPCTKTKPYPFSSEHQAINQRLLDTGWRPTAPLTLPEELLARLPKGISPEVLNLSVLDNGRGTVVHRMVISEPLAVVPYEHIANYNGKASPSAAYDDPGLFENRGNAVSPWRADCTATRVSATKWKWGDEERRHYVLMHNAMSDALARFLARIGGHYTDIVAWVAPGLTHRSFVLAQGERSAHGVPASRQVGNGRLALVGANDHLDAGGAIECLPTAQHCKDAVSRLAARLGTSISHAAGVYSRGGVNATPLALPEMLDVLIERLERGASPS